MEAKATEADVAVELLVLLRGKYYRSATALLTEAAPLMAAKHNIYPRKVLAHHTRLARQLVWRVTDSGPDVDKLFQCLLAHGALASAFEPDLAWIVKYVHRDPVTLILEKFDKISSRTREGMVALLSDDHWFFEHKLWVQDSDAAALTEAQRDLKAAQQRIEKIKGRMEKKRKRNED